LGYNPINGESYSNVNSKNNETEKQPESIVKAPEESNGNAQEANPTENGNAQAAPPTIPTANGNAPAVPAEANATVNSAQAPPAENKNGQKVDNAQKNVHTSVRVFHPPGGKSNGPLW
jgi:hypothetical protein